MNGFTSFITKIAAIGAVKRKGLGGLEAYGGRVDGEGKVIHKSGPKAGTETKFTMRGQPGARSQ